MFSRRHLLSFLALSLSLRASAQSSAWGQCGGSGWTGATTCVAGYTCTVQSEWYSQCLPDGSATTTTGSGTSATAALPTATSTATKLHTAAQAAGLTYFGTATDNSELSDAAYKVITSDADLFGQITPGNSMKWDATEPSRGTFTFTNGDIIQTLAEANGQLLRGHTTVWHSQLPSWVSNGGFDNATLLEIVDDHVTAVIGHYKGKTYAWDVVNEVFGDDGALRPSVFYNTTGTAYIARAFTAARAADPDTKLYINDYNIDGTGTKSSAVISLVRDLKAQGVPIDGIGLQAHLIVGSVPTTIQTNLQAMVDLGVEVAITELDIRMTLPETEALRNQQRKDYETVVSACVNVVGCIGVTIWDWTDKYSWVPSVFSGQGAALPYDAGFVAKSAYDGIVDALSSA